MGIKEVLGIKNFNSSRHGLNDERLYWDVAYRMVDDQLMVDLVYTDGRVIYYDVILGPRFSPREYSNAIKTVQRYVKDPIEFKAVAKRVLDFMFPTQPDIENEI